MYVFKIVKSTLKIKSKLFGENLQNLPTCQEYAWQPLWQNNKKVENTA